MAALNHPDRITRLIMANAAHPFTYQKALFDDPDQRMSAQYITEMRQPDFEAKVLAMGWDAYFDSRFAEPKKGAAFQSLKDRVDLEFDPAHRAAPGQDARP